MNFASFAFKSTLPFLKSFPPCSQMFRHYCPNLHFDGNLNTGAQVYVQNGLNLQSIVSNRYYRVKFFQDKLEDMDVAQLATSIGSVILGILCLNSGCNGLTDQ